MTVKTSPPQTFACRCFQPFELSGRLLTLDGGPPSVWIDVGFADAGTARAIYEQEFAGVPTAGKQSSAAAPRTKLGFRQGAQGWAVDLGGSGMQRGSMQLDITKVTARQIAKQSSFEVHGVATGQLVPDTAETTTSLDVTISF